MTQLAESPALLAPDSFCRFCYADRPGDEPHIRLTNGSPAIATFGALVPRWSLVLAPSHVPATACLTSELRAQLFADVDELARHFRPSSVFFFEHGAATATSATACTTAHAHVHVVPIEGDVVGHADERFPLDGSWEEMEVADLDRVAGVDYLLAGVAGTRPRVKILRQPISQYFRRVIADMMGRPARWDWHEIVDRTEYLRTQAYLATLRE